MLATSLTQFALKSLLHFLNYFVLNQFIPIFTRISINKTLWDGVWQKTKPIRIFMAYSLTCPSATALPGITDIKTCFRMGQVQRIILQRVFSSGTTKNSMTISSANPNVIATWTPLFAASDGTHAVTLPTFGNPVLEPGEIIEFGSAGGNDVVNGIPITIGKGPSKFTGMWRDKSLLSMKEIDDIRADNSELGVYFLAKDSAVNGKVIGTTDSLSSPTVFRPIPIQSFYIKDRTIGGFAEPDQVEFGFYLAPDWDKELHAVTPSDYNAITDLV